MPGLALFLLALGLMVQFLPWHLTFPTSLQHQADFISLLRSPLRFTSLSMVCQNKLRKSRKGTYEHISRPEVRINWHQPQQQTPSILNPHPYFSSQYFKCVQTDRQNKANSAFQVSWNMLKTTPYSWAHCNINTHLHQYVSIQIANS